MKRISTVVAAVLALGAFPFALTILMLAASDYLHGFDDFALGRMFLGLTLSLVASVIGAVFVFRHLRRNAFRIPCFIIATAGVFDVVALPTARLLGKWEQERRYAAPSAAQAPDGTARTLGHP